MPDTKRNGKNFCWSEAEIEVLRHLYPQGGVLLVRPLLPARADHSINCKAALLGIRFHSGYYRQPDSTPMEDKSIRAIYARGGRADSAKLHAHLRKYKRTRQWVRSRAIQLGYVAMPSRRHWTPAEEAILRDCEGIGTRQTQRLLTQAGYRRTEPAIAERWRSMGLSARYKNADVYTANDVSALLGMDIHIILSWCQRGRLKARADSTFVGTIATWHIDRKDLRSFLISHPLEWYPGRCDRPWLVDILSGQEGALA